MNSQKQCRADVQGKLPANEALPGDVPSAPWLVYRNRGWTNWGDFLGTDNPVRHLIEYRLFVKARTYVRGLKLANVAAWRELCGRKVGNRRVLQTDILAAPERVYEGKAG